MAGLDPDLILTQDLCRACALPSGQVETALGFLGCRADVLSLDPRSLDDVLASIQLVGDRTGCGDRADALVAGLRARLRAVEAAVAGRRWPRVAVIEWVDPPFTAGHWVPDLVRAAGGHSVGGQPGEPSIQSNWVEIRECEPELVIVAPCGFHLDDAAAQATAVLAKLPGVPIWAIDADASLCDLDRGWWTVSRPSRQCCIRAAFRRRPRSGGWPKAYGQCRALAPGLRPVTSL